MTTLPIEPPATQPSHSQTHARPLLLGRNTGDRRRDLSDRVFPQVAAPTGGVPGRAPGRDPERGVRRVGDLRPHSVPALLRRAPAAGAARLDAVPAGCVLRQLAARGWRDPRDHDRVDLAGGVILAIMIVPYIAAVSREVLLAVPPSQREAALGMGATRWEAVWTAVVPYGRAGLIGAVILGLGRALGETMAVTMLIGNRHDIGVSVLQPAYTMAAAIANEFSEATTDLYLSALFEVGLILFVITVAVNALARLMIWRVARGTAVGSRAL